MQETIDEEFDWVLVNYRSEAASKLSDYLLREYIVIEAWENAEKAKNDEEWLNVGQNKTINSARSRKVAKRARKRAKRTANT